MDRQAVEPFEGVSGGPNDARIGSGGPQGVNHCRMRSEGHECAIVLKVYVSKPVRLMCTSKSWRTARWRQPRFGDSQSFSTQCSPVSLCACTAYKESQLKDLTRYAVGVAT